MVQLAGELLGALSRLPGVQVIDGPFVVLALHGLQEADDGALRGASAQGVVVGDLGLHWALHRRAGAAFSAAWAPLTRQAASSAAMAIRIEYMGPSFPGLPAIRLPRKALANTLKPFNPETIHSMNFSAR